MALALAGAGIATYLALYELRVVDRAWEPLFGMGSAVILNSFVSRALPMSEAALGASAYLLAAVMGAIGGRRRWRTRPWLVVAFGLVVSLLGMAGIVLVVLQPVLLGGWCTLCLASAVISVLMVGPAVDEVLATLQHVRRESLRGSSPRRVFWGLRERRRDWLEDPDEEDGDEGEEPGGEEPVARRPAVEWPAHRERRRRPRPVRRRRAGEPMRPEGVREAETMPRAPEGGAGDRERR